ncbi:MAG: sugar phosphate isomerase/epimerase [Pirellulales bacterium]|nr:sugar phosphate isomerase/epimerase [Pirellulales bacterium]
MLLAYNTNGLAHHDLVEAIELLAEIGYQGVAITLDHGALNPFDERLPVQLGNVKAALSRRGMVSVIETGARYLLDSRVKHEPTLVSPKELDRARRIYFLRRAIDIAAQLNSRCVSLWSGVVHDGASQDEAFQRLVTSLVHVLEHAERRNVQVAFEPEPGMLVDTLASFDRLLAELSSQGVEEGALGVTLDIGHLHCLGEVPISAKILQSAARLANIHLEDMRAGVHEHLQFGEGDIAFGPVIAALAQIGYNGLLGVELSRHSHVGPAAARQAHDFLRPMLGKSPDAPSKAFSG